MWFNDTLLEESTCAVKVFSEIQSFKYSAKHAVILTVLCFGGDIHLSLVNFILNSVLMLKVAHNINKRYEI